MRTKRLLIPLLAVALVCLPNAARAQADAGAGAGFRALNGGVGGIDFDALAYIHRAGVTNLTGQARVDGFVKSMKYHGLWSLLYDAIPMSSLMQPSNGNALVTMKGRFTTLHATNGPLRGVRGISFDGVNDRIYGVTASALPAFSVAAQMAGSTNNSGTPFLWQFLDSGLVEYHGVIAPSSGYNVAAYRTVGGGGAATTDDIVHQLNVTFCWGWTYLSDVSKLVTTGHDNSGSGNTILWVDGMENLALGNKLTSRTFGTGASVLSIGCNYSNATPANFAQMNMSGLALFGSQLSYSQSSNLVECMRWLDPAEKNLVIVGDSYSDDQPGAGGGRYPFWCPWPNALKQFGYTSNEFVILNKAMIGLSSPFIDYRFQAMPFRPGIGGVAESWLGVCLGYNDAAGGNNPGTTWANINTFVQRARADGYKVFGVLYPHSQAMVSAPAVSTGLTNLLSIQSYYLTNREVFDFVVRWDNIIGDTNVASGWAGDAIHPSAEGERRLANAVHTALIQRKTGPAGGFWSQPMTNNGAGATDLLFRWQPGSELRDVGDSITYSVAGGFTNETTAAKLVTFVYGSEEVLNSGSMTLNKGPWNATIKITLLGNNSQQVQSTFSGTATNFTQVMVASQTNSYPVLMKVRATGAQSGQITNSWFAWDWRPIKP